ncbi:MAG TPA: hypothetical protein VIC87_06200 [Vicinamibacteria bacterium]
MSARMAGAATVLLLVAFVVLSERSIGRSYEWDEGVYLASARLVARGEPLFERVFSSQPPVYLETLALAFRFFGEKAEVGAQMSLLFAVAGLAAAAWIGARVIGPAAAPVVVLAMLSKVFLDQATSVQAEMPALGLALLSVALLLPPLGHRTSALALGGAVFCLAVLTKLWIAPCLVPAVFLVLLDPRPEDDGRWTARWSAAAASRRLLVFGLAGAFVGVAGLARYDGWSLREQVFGLHWRAREIGVEYWGRDGLDVMARFARREAFPCVLALAGFVVLLRRNLVAAAWLALWLAVAFLFLAGHAPVFYRHVLLLAPPVALLAAAPLCDSTGRRTGLAITVVLAVLLVLRPAVGRRGGVGLVFPVGTQLSARTTPDPEREEAVELIRRLSRPGDLVVSDDPLQVFLAGRDLPPELVDASATRILSGNLTADFAATHSAGAAVIQLWTRRLEQLPGYRDWVRGHYRRVRRWESPAEARSGEVGRWRELYVPKRRFP